ncbi:MAG: hypothetical protein AVDCRST_MAG10-74, partial [uncultured Acidimicrobiales bacterium]
AGRRRRHVHHHGPGRVPLLLHQPPGRPWPGGAVPAADGRPVRGRRPTPVARGRPQPRRPPGPDHRRRGQPGCRLPLHGRPPRQPHAVSGGLRRTGPVQDPHGHQERPRPGHRLRRRGAGGGQLAAGRAVGPRRVRGRHPRRHRVEGRLPRGGLGVAPGRAHLRRHRAGRLPARPPGRRRRPAAARRRGRGRAPRRVGAHGGVGHGGPAGHRRLPDLPGGVRLPPRERPGVVVRRRPGRQHGRLLPRCGGGAPAAPALRGGAHPAGLAGDGGGGRPGGGLDRRPARRRPPGGRGGSGRRCRKAGVRQHRATRRARRHPRPHLRPVRDPFPAGLGGRRRPAGGRPHPQWYGARAARPHRRPCPVVLPGRAPGPRPPPRAGPADRRRPGRPFSGAGARPPAAGPPL